MTDQPDRAERLLQQAADVDEAARAAAAAAQEPEASASFTSDDPSEIRRDFAQMRGKEAPDNPQHAAEQLAAAADPSGVRAWARRIRSR